MVRVRNHRNPLRSTLLQLSPPPLELLSPASELAVPAERTARPIEVELGCADAQFLFQLARRDAETHYVGIEIRDALVDDVNARARAEGLARLRAVYAHINVNLPAIFDGKQAVVRRFYINFPDPWWKRAHHKRRLVTRELAVELWELLTPDGELYFQSDVFELALDAMAVLESTPGFVNASPSGEWSFFRQSPFPARSLREDRVESRGLPVFRMLYRKTAAPPPHCDLGAAPPPR
jgi:tRNA (guanine-N7-)-methyltransferase